LANRTAKLTFPVWGSVMVLSVIALAASAMVWPMALAIFGSEGQVHQAIAYAAITAWVAMLIGLAPVAAMRSRGDKAMTKGYFVGAGIRTSVCVAMTVGSIQLGGLPVGPWATALMGVYIPLLFVEAAIVGRYMWRRNEAGSFHGNKLVGSLSSNVGGSTQMVS